MLYNPPHPLETRVLTRRFGMANSETIETYLATDGYQAFLKAAKMTPEAIIEEVKVSNLRGLVGVAVERPGVAAAQLVADEGGGALRRRRGCGRSRPRSCRRPSATTSPGQRRAALVSVLSAWSSTSVIAAASHSVCG